MPARAFAAALALALAAPHGAPTAAADGLPDPVAPRRRVVVTESSYEVLGPIRFSGATAALTAESAGLLDAIARTLDGNPDITLVEIRAYGTGPARKRQKLADARARAIAEQLVLRGVAAARLRPNGIARPPRGSAGDPEMVIVRRGS